VILNVCALIALIVQAGGSWPLAAMLALPVLPIIDLARTRVRRLASAGLERPTLVGLDSRS